MTSEVDAPEVGVAVKELEGGSDARGRGAGRGRAVRGARGERGGTGAELDTWNLGGTQMERLPDILGSLIGCGVRDVVVVAFQEVNMSAGVHYLKAGPGDDGWLIVAGKNEGEWRGRATAIRRRFGVVAHRQTETGKQLTTWESMCAAKEKALMIMGDFNETLTRERESDEITHRTARGALLVHWFHVLDMNAPPQQIGMPSYYPYNQAHRPRRLDYVLVRGVDSAEGGEVHPIRQMAASDLEGVSVAILGARKQPRADCGASMQPRHGPKELKPQTKLEQALRETPRCRGDPQQAIQQMANDITQPRRNYRAFRESREIKQLRVQAKQARDGQQARILWKQTWRLRAKEKEAWQRELLTAVLAKDWQALRATKAARRTEVWEEELTTQESWKETMQEHFEGIFAKMPAAQVKTGLAEIWAQLQHKCKTTRWRPFSTEEVSLSTMSWASGKSAGPDGISYEAFKALLQHREWEATILEEFNDALYKGRAPANTKKSITILLPKTKQPAEWGQTRPITLSSSMLKWQAQLLLGRRSHHARCQVPICQTWKAGPRTGFDAAESHPHMSRVGRARACSQSGRVESVRHSITTVPCGNHQGQTGGWRLGLGSPPLD